MKGRGKGDFTLARKVGYLLYHCRPVSTVVLKEGDDARKRGGERMETRRRE